MRLPPGSGEAQVDVDARGQDLAVGRERQGLELVLGLVKAAELATRWHVEQEDDAVAASSPRSCRPPSTRAWRRSFGNRRSTPLGNATWRVSFRPWRYPKTEPSLRDRGHRPAVGRGRKALMNERAIPTGPRRPGIHPSRCPRKSRHRAARRPVSCHQATGPHIRLSYR